MHSEQLYLIKTYSDLNSWCEIFKDFLPWSLDSRLSQVEITFPENGWSSACPSVFSHEYCLVTAAALSQGYGYILFGYNTWGVYLSLLDTLPKQALASCLVLFCTITLPMLCSQRTSMWITRKRRLKSNIALAAAVAKEVVEHSHQPWLQADYINPHFFHCDNTHKGKTDTVFWASRGLNLTLLRTTHKQAVQAWLSNKVNDARAFRAWFILLVGDTAISVVLLG